MLLNWEDAAVSFKTLNKNLLEEENEIFTPTEWGFDFSLALFDEHNNDILHWNDILKFNVRQVRQYYELNETTHQLDRKRNWTDLPLEKCSRTIFNFTDEQTYKSLDIHDHYCTNMWNYTVWGNFITPRFDYLEFRFNKCVNTTDQICQSEEEINWVLNGAYF